MAYAVVQGSSNGNTGSGTSHVITLPSSIVAGEKLLVLFTCDDNITVNTPGGWTKAVDYQAASLPTNKIVALHKIAAGSDTLTITTGSNTTSTFICYRILTDNDLEFSAGASGTSTTPNPATLTPAGGSQQYVFFAVAAWGGGVTVSSYPSNYTDNQVANTTGCSLAVATRSVTASSEDPGTYTISVSTEWIAITVSAEPQTPAAANFPIITQTSTILQPAIDFAADATFPIITQTSTIFASTAYAANLAQWSNTTKSSATWTNSDK